MPRKEATTCGPSRVPAARHSLPCVPCHDHRRTECRAATLAFRFMASQGPSSLHVGSSPPPATPVQAVYGPAGKTETWQPVDAGHIGALVKALARNVFEAHMSKEKSPGVSNWEAWKMGVFTAKAQPLPALGSQPAMIRRDRFFNVASDTQHVAAVRKHATPASSVCSLLFAQGEADSSHLGLRRGVGPLQHGAIRTHAHVGLRDHGLRPHSHG